MSDSGNEQVEFLLTPDAFYTRLMELVSKATRRVSIATLYIGTSDMEGKLLSAIQHADVPTHILLDGLRANRMDQAGESSVSMIRKICPNAVVDEFVSPLYTGLYTALPARLREVVGTQHMKLVVVDDTVIVTGANLSRLYFTNRQDRYVVIRNASLANSIDSVIKQRGSQAGVEGPIDLSDAKVSFGTQRGFQTPGSGQSDHVVVQALTELLDSDATVTLASPYLNLSPDILSLLVRFPRVNIVTNSPETNAFHNSKGLSRFIPEAYSILQDDLMASLDRGQVSFHEYSRPGWSFHPKGIWLSKNGRVHSTVIGSSNFGFRSKFRDLEISFRIDSDSPRVQSQLSTEVNGIMQYCRSVSNQAATRRGWLQYLVRGPLRTFL